LSGAWTIAGKSVTSDSATSSLTEKISAKNVYMVASSGSSPDETVDVSLANGATNDFGSDAPGGKAIISTDRLYHIISYRQFTSATVTVTVPPGVSIYTFTFGS
jgi:hypothetical protein